LFLALCCRDAAADETSIAAITVNGIAATINDGFAHWQAVMPLNSSANTLVVATKDSGGNARHALSLRPMSLLFAVDLENGERVLISIGPS